VPRTYGRFARYYDEVYRDIVDYKADADYLETLFQRFLRRRPRAVLDLGCGTGNHAVELARRGHKVTGLDASRAQLEIARAKVRGRRHRATFLQGDMRGFRLHGPFDAAVCMFGSFGYLLTDADVLAHFAAVRRHLPPDGIYAFEFWQESAAIPGLQSWLTRERPHRLLRLSQSRLDHARHRLTIDFHFYVFKGNRVVDRFSESHTTRLYTVREVRRLLNRAGLSLAAAFAATPKVKGFARPGKKTFRVMAVARPIPKLRAR
jgi:SAM-dependent methyltransferase